MRTENSDLFSEIPVMQKAWTRKVNREDLGSHLLEGRDGRRTKSLHQKRAEVNEEKHEHERTREEDRRRKGLGTQLERARVSGCVNNIGDHNLLLSSLEPRTDQTSP